MAEKYFAKLERQWEQKWKTMFGPALSGPKTKRAKSLRGSDFIGELIRLAALTKDTRFQDAAVALFEHDIIDDNFNFLPWEAPAVAKVQKEIELRAFTFIYWVVTFRGTPLRRSCAQIAAQLGWPGASFAAAIKDLELIYRRHLAEDRCFDPITLDLFKKFAAIEMRNCGTEKLELSCNQMRNCGIEKLEFLCSTSIPTTANN